MTGDEVWRPLGFESDEAIAEYDALHDGVPPWMAAAFWAWVLSSITHIRTYKDGSGRVAHLNEGLTEHMAQSLRIPLPNLRVIGTDYREGQGQLSQAMEHLRKHGQPIQIADYILAHFPRASAPVLDDLLERSKSVWRVGTRSGKPGMVRRVPLGVQVGGDTVMARSGRAGVRLAAAWGQLYSPTPNDSEAYRSAILAVEDAAIPVVSPTNTSATLGTVLNQIADQGDWGLPMTREHPQAPSRDVVVGMMRLLWHGQHDRHGGQPSAPGNASHEEAIVAVGLATTLVHWIDAGLLAREPAA